MENTLNLIQRPMRLIANAITNRFNRQNTADLADIAKTFKAPKRFRSCANQT
ncbi:MAG TPA: hypothetical protein VN633_21610 [Bryobacteraceae bacterium]|nr:hypothetical protein [Bryobacteraceae bacterium]